jgi:hypothetical protein
MLVRKNKLVEKVGSKYKIKEMGFPENFVGFQIYRVPGADMVILHQQRYIQQIAARFGVSRGTPNPMVKYTQASQEDNSAKFEFDFEYSSLVGALLFAAICTRIDISFAIGYLSRFTADPKPAHFRAGLRVLSYLFGSSSWGIPLGESMPAKLVTFVDSDWAGDLDDRKSTGAAVMFYRGGPIFWQSREDQIYSFSI